MNKSKENSSYMTVAEVKNYLNISQAAAYASQRSLYHKTIRYYFICCKMCFQ